MNLNKIFFLDKSFIKEFLFVIAFFTSPNIPLIIRNLYGTFLYYVLITILLSLVLPTIIRRRGLEKIRISDVVIASLSLCLIYVLMGVLIGLNTRSYTSIYSIVTQFYFFLVNTLLIETTRSLSMSVTPSYKARIIVGTMIGLFAGKTLLATKTYMSNVVYNPVLLISDLILSLILTMFHLEGSFASAFVFRFITGVFWKFSPIIPNKNLIEVPWMSLESLMMVSIYLLLSYIHVGINDKSDFLKHESIKKKLLGYVTKASFTFLLVFFVVLVFGGFIPLVITSNSMNPYLKVGDIVIIKSTDDYGVGEIIAYKYDSFIVVHRIVGFDEKGFITKGDNNAEPDPYVVSPQQVIGKKLLRIPYVGLISLALKGNLYNNYEISFIIIALSISAFALYILIRKYRV